LEWVRAQGVTDVDMMTNLPKSLRSKLTQHTNNGSLAAVSNLVSEVDGTIKRAYKVSWPS